MSTITRDTAQAPLPHTGRGETLFGLLALVVGFLAVLAKVLGLFA